MHDARQKAGELCGADCWVCLKEEQRATAIRGAQLVKKTLAQSRAPIFDLDPHYLERTLKELGAIEEEHTA